MMLRLLCLFVGLVATVSDACEAPFRQVGDGCYYFSSEFGLDLTWTEARQYCQSMGADVDLAVFDLMCDDFKTMATYLLIEDPAVFIPEMYIGATGSGSSWNWVDGRPLSATSSNWFYYHPTNNSDEASVCLFSSKESGFQRFYLGNYHGGYHKAFMCQSNVIVRKSTQ